MSFLTLPASIKSVQQIFLHAPKAGTKKTSSGADGEVKAWKSGCNDTQDSAAFSLGQYSLWFAYHCQIRLTLFGIPRKKHKSIAVAQIYTVLIPYNSTTGPMPVGSYWLAPGFQRHVASRKH